MYGAVRTATQKTSAVDQIRQHSGESFWGCRIIRSDERELKIGSVVTPHRTKLFMS
jgi:hypothetical protein